MAMDEPPADLWDRIWLPRRPLATDDPTTGLTRTSRTLALDRRLIETNPAALTSLLAVDVDHPDALIRALWDRADWLPTVVTENPGNGHAHAHRYRYAYQHADAPSDAHARPAHTDP